MGFSYISIVFGTSYSYFLINRDAYGFPVRPQHVQRYREYADIYKVLCLYLRFSAQDFHPHGLLEQLSLPFIWLVLSI